jgi:hypothetical protein
MGRYISITLQFKSATAGPELLRPLFFAENFRPIGILGNGSSPTATSSWMVAGYGLESVVSQYSWPDRGGPAEVELMSSPPSVSNGYLEWIAGLIRARECPTRRLSEHERAEQEVGATFIDAPVLDVSILKHCSDWMAKCQSSIIELVGTFHVSALASRNSYDWKNAFRFLVDPTERVPLGIPFVQVTLIPPAREVRIFSESTIWARNVRSLNGLVSGDEADENLGRLADIVNLLRSGGPKSRHRRSRSKGATFETN